MAFHDEQRFQELWQAVEIARPVHYSLFTFGESVLPYYLVCEPPRDGKIVSVTRGDVRITRPTIITPYNVHPEFRNFFEDAEGEQVADLMLARSAGFSHLKLDNHAGAKQLVSDSVEEVVSKLNHQLDAEEEDRVAILTAPHALGGVALLKYAADRVWSSAADNIQELRERGFLP